MSRPPDEYFAAPGAAPGEPPEGYFDDRPPELDASIDEMSMICGRQDGKQTTLDEIMRWGRKAGLAPLCPLPPEWFTSQSGSRLRCDTPSVPELEMYRNQCLAWLTLAPGGWPWMTAYHALEGAEQALDDARWRLACESYRWVRDYPTITDEQAWWSLMTLIAARRSEVLAEAGTCWSGKELAVREVAG